VLRFVARRLAFIAFVSLLIVFFSHFGMRMVRNSEASRPNYDLVQHGISAWTDSREYINRLLQGDLGRATLSFGTASIGEILNDTYIKSMGLLMISLAFAAFVGLAVGGAMAITQKRWLVLPILTATLLGVSAPSFVAALLLQIGEITFLRTFGKRLVYLTGFGWDYQHFLLPVLVLMARPVAYLTRAAHLGLRNIMEEDFIRTAFSKGLSLNRTVNVHALRNMIIPMLTAVGVSVRFSLSTLPIVELFFYWPGMGLRILEAINGRQTTLVVTLALALGCTFLFVNLLLDVLYRLIDPRLREESWTS
jgi:ABC-type dipeptide/oligopeptide/nickel transport system permease component